MKMLDKIKHKVTPIMVAEHYLGQPTKKCNLNYIYISPFRKEKTPSFCVNDKKGFHDFGDGWHGDVINFVERFYNTDFKNAIQILSSDFGLSIDKGVSKELRIYLKQKRTEELQMKKNLNSWFENTLNKLCDALHKWQEVIPLLRGDALAIAYSKEQYLDYIIDVFINATEEEKIYLWKDKKNIEKLF